MNKLAIFFTVYNRFEYLQRSIELFKLQSNKNFDLFIVNNSGQNIDELIDIESQIINANNKYKHFTRFVAVKEVLDRGYEIIAFVDDDIIIPANYVEECYRQYDPRYVKSFWAFEIREDYWKRTKLTGTKDGHYCGGGGLLAPAELFRVPQLYDCPEEYWIIDDLWMSHVILAYTDYKIRIFSVRAKVIEDSKATWRKVKQLKSEFAAKYILPYR